MKYCVRVAVAVVVFCVVVEWDSCWSAQPGAKQPEPNPQSSELVYRCEYVRAAIATEKLKDRLDNNPNLKPHIVGYDDRTNSVIVTGPPNSVLFAKNILEKIDQPNSNEPLRAVLAPIFQVHNVANGKASETAKMLTDMGRGSIRYTAISDTQIMVYAPAADQAEIAALFELFQRRPEITRVFALNDAQAIKIADLILDKLCNDPGAPMVKSDMSKNAIIVIGMPNQVEAVRLMIESLSGEKTQVSKEK